MLNAALGRFDGKTVLTVLRIENALCPSAPQQLAVPEPKSPSQASSAAYLPVGVSKMCEQKDESVVDTPPDLFFSLVCIKGAGPPNARGYHVEFEFMERRGALVAFQSFPDKDHPMKARGHGCVRC